jgi:hypothetical protein
MLSVKCHSAECHSIGYRQLVWDKAKGRVTVEEG